MFRRLGWLVGLNYRSWSGKRLTDAKPHPGQVKPVAMFDTVQEIAIYIHRFHNLDLFQQGWVAFFLTIIESHYYAIWIFLFNVILCSV